MAFYEGKGVFGNCWRADFLQGRCYCLRVAATSGTEAGVAIAFGIAGSKVRPESAGLGRFPWNWDGGSCPARLALIVGELVGSHDGTCAGVSCEVVARRVIDCDLNIHDACSSGGGAGDLTIGSALNMGCLLGTEEDVYAVPASREAASVDRYDCAARRWAAAEG